MMVIIKQLEHSADLFHTKFRSHEVLSCFSCVCCRLISGAAAVAAYHHACHKHTQHIHNTTQRKHIYHHICISYIPKIVTHWELQVYGDMTRSWLSICWWLCCSFIWQWSTFIFSTFSKKLKFFPKLFSFSPSLLVELIFCTEKSLNIISCFEFEFKLQNCTTWVWQSDTRIRLLSKYGRFRVENLGVPTWWAPE